MKKLLLILLTVIIISLAAFVYPQAQKGTFSRDSNTYLIQNNAVYYSQDSTASKIVFDNMRVGFEFNGRQDEFNIGMYYEHKIGIYRPIYELNMAILNYEGETLTSSAALYSLGYIMVAGIIAVLIHKDELSNSETRDKFLFIYCIPLLLTNAEHHLSLVNSPSPDNVNKISLSAFINFKTDVFKNKGVIYSPGFGIQTEYDWGTADNYFKNSFVLQAGVEYPYEFKVKDFQEIRPFAGIKISF